MDKQGNIWTPEEVQQRLGELTGAEGIPRKHSPDEPRLQDEHCVSDESPRKVSLSEYLKSRISTETEDREGAEGSRGF